ncbi:hypothetical protein Bca4012_027180 [Brassica carinata]|uniref:Uncharacterized protein n=1 Tax=Brassica carinata TaxID=52824 RepID=A0A8X7VJT6_BRACI|nr:hypothetical protein Bca52824_024173 [Brassica carinata]
MSLRRDHQSPVDKVRDMERRENNKDIAAIDDSKAPPGESNRSCRTKTPWKRSANEPTPP